MASQQDLQHGSNYPTHFLSIERQTKIFSFTHSPCVSLRCGIKSSSLEYMNEFLVDIFQLYCLVAMVTKARYTVKFRQAKFLSRHIIIVEIDLLKCLCDYVCKPVIHKVSKMDGCHGKNNTILA